MASLKEKIGYGFGDMASSMFWKVFSAYLPIFYTNVFGLDLGLAAMLFLVTKIWDAVSDPMMGIIADRTNTKWGKYRPYLLWISVPFAIAGVLLFTTPGFGETGKNIWAFVTYILMMTIYTAINVPYGSMLGVMTDDSDEKTVFSSYRMFFAYTGSFLVLLLWEPLCNAFAGTSGKVTYDPQAWQYAMIVVGVACCLLFILTFRMTRERIKPDIKQASIKDDFASLLRNGPWWILLGGVLFFNFFGAVRYAVIPYYFATEISGDATLSLFSLDFVFYAGLFFTVGEVANMVGVAMATPITFRIGKKNTFLNSLLAIIVLCIAFYYVPTDTSSGLWTLLVLQIATGVYTGIISPLVWSMYADISDYAELKFRTASTGLIFSSSSMAQKFGGAFGTSAVLWMLAAVGFNTAEGAVQTPEAIEGLRYLISWIPAGIAALSALFILFYPLTTRRMKEINNELKRGR